MAESSCSIKSREVLVHDEEMDSWRHQDDQEVAR